MTKVVWKPVQKEVPALYNFIHHFSFMFEEYEELLNLYDSKSKDSESENDTDVETEVACAWLKSNGSRVAKKIHQSWFEEKRHLMQLQQKPRLYIGGIFPLSGTKYKAPVLADGKFNW